MKSLEYFDALYANNADPWHYKTRWYEQRKRAINLAVLTKPHYRTAIELGCSNGVFTQDLATRCDKLLAIDGNAQAVALAKEHLEPLTHVQVQQAFIPSQLPNETFDLVVIGEILYYLTLQEIHQVLQWLNHALNPDATLLCTHWRYAIDGFEMNGDTVHQQLLAYFNQSATDFYHQVHLQDADFMLDVWQRTQQSLAASEGLVNS